jgi:hypothetical protein
MGSYYVMELSRSEGYELSVNGISLKESNRTQDIVNRIHEAGQARISGGLSDYNSMDADGSWNDFIVESYKTEMILPALSTKIFSRLLFRYALNLN